ncbi:MAG: 30S ribosomal protein S20 [SAR324 cluster bacterium]|nr:30S ribosomal protein S20 [SAR324 cluster bacterium]
MANHKSAIKRAKQNERRRIHNRTIRSAYRTEIKKFNALIDAGSKEEATAALPAVQKVIDKACSKGIIKKNSASRKKSRLTISLNKALAAA